MAKVKLATNACGNSLISLPAWYTLPALSTHTSIVLAGPLEITVRELPVTTFHSLTAPSKKSATKTLLPELSTATPIGWSVPNEKRVVSWPAPGFHFLTAFSLSLI